MPRLQRMLLNQSSLDNDLHIVQSQSFYKPLRCSNQWQSHGMGKEFFEGTDLLSWHMQPLN